MLQFCFEDTSNPTADPVLPGVTVWTILDIDRGVFTIYDPPGQTEFFTDDNPKETVRVYNFTGWRPKSADEDKQYIAQDCMPAQSDCVELVAQVRGGAGNNPTNLQLLTAEQASLAAEFEFTDLNCFYMEFSLTAVEPNPDFAATRPNNPNTGRYVGASC
eukprot:scaffold1988_cov270-Prasinococcus_capsulatus_cf.AAC.6